MAKDKKKVRIMIEGYVDIEDVTDQTVPLISNALSIALPPGAKLTDKSRIKLSHMNVELRD